MADETRELLDAVIDAWREGWDCSAHPGHEVVENAIRAAEHGREEIDARRPSSPAISMALPSMSLMAAEERQQDEHARRLEERGDFHMESAKRLSEELVAARARLSRAREVLDTVSCALDAARAFLPPFVETPDYVASDRALDDAVAALRAALGS